MTLGNKIKAKRLQLGLSQQELADRINIKRQTIQKYEQGIITNLPLDRVQALADALEVSPAYLMGWDHEEKLAKQPYAAIVSSSIYAVETYFIS